MRLQLQLLCPNLAYLMLIFRQIGVFLGLYINVFQPLLSLLYADLLQANLVRQHLLFLCFVPLKLVLEVVHLRFVVDVAGDNGGFDWVELDGVLMP